LQYTNPVLKSIVGQRKTIGDKKHQMLKYDPLNPPRGDFGPVQV
jgi:hypothetical protein